MSAGAPARRVLVWDLPTRAFHWLLALGFAGAYLSGEADGWLLAHALFGYTVLGLVAFRLVWGLSGTRYARFASFAFAPSAVTAYLVSLLTPSPRHYVGHNPAGAWAIFALLGLAALSGASGWLALHDLGGKVMEEVHEGLATAMLAMVALHIAGVIVSSRLHRENLARAMVDGYKLAAPEAGLPGSVWSVGVLLIAAVAAFWGSALRGDLPALTQPALEYQQREAERRREHQRERRRSDRVMPIATAGPALRSASNQPPPVPH